MIYFALTVAFILIFILGAIMYAGFVYVISQLARLAEQNLKITKYLSEFLSEITDLQNGIDKL